MSNRRSGMEALASAIDGTVCVRSKRRPRDFVDMLENQATARVLLMVVELNSFDVLDIRHNLHINIPSLETRTRELPDLIDCYVQDAAKHLMLPQSLFTDEDRAWVVANAATSIPDIERATMRMLAIRASRNLGIAANRLGMARVSLERWLRRRDRTRAIVEPAA